MGDDVDWTEQSSPGPAAEVSQLLAEDDLYRALAGRGRRRTMAILLDSGVRHVDDIATVLLGWEVSESNGVGSPAERDRIAVRLHHVDLPVLADVGLIAYDPESRVVAPTEVPPDVADLVRRSIAAESAHRR
ncbi:DUF7344 domain-containing protein [Halobaculum marinum]|uniref:ArsR family transcriptional regulator n=1 Tax=Halobaculum marinum TaxID=3031996 RepID=A0ABD5WXU5_9EURY|nr:ArsR family transcriptional regulator [Halobaculum sp. DT55]